MPVLRIIETLSDPGDPARVNEDAAGGNRSCAFVIDGATGLGTGSIVGIDGSDAAWLAHFAKTFLEQNTVAGRKMSDVVEALNGQAGIVVREAAGGSPVEAWNLPIASFQMIRVENAAIVAHGLGDCRLFLTGADGSVFETSAMKGNFIFEREGARRALAHAGGLAAIGSLSNDPAVREELRRHRAAYNRPGAQAWTLGTEPAAARHLVSEALDAALPATGLLCTDGFAALSDQYGRYDPAGMIASASLSGFPALMRELRRIERTEDPDGARYPRFKASDDATAVLFEIAER
jgi:hypothetical protein